MTERSVLLKDSRARRAAGEARARQARRRHRVRMGAVVGAVGCAALLIFMASVASGPSSAGSRAAGVRRAPLARIRPARSSYGAELAPAAQRFRIKLKLPVSSAILLNAGFAALRR